MNQKDQYNRDAKLKVISTMVFALALGLVSVLIAYHVIPVRHPALAVAGLLSCGVVLMLIGVYELSTASRRYKKHHEQPPLQEWEKPPHPG